MRRALVVTALAVISAVGAGVAFATPTRTAAPLGNTYTFRGNGGKTLPPIQIRTPSTLLWAASGGIFQIFNDGDGSGGDVNSQASRGATYMPPAAYKLDVNAMGDWIVKIVPGIERPQRVSPGYLGFRGNGGRTLPPFSTPRGTNLYWRAGGGIFQLFSEGFNGPDVNSQAASGTTYMESGRHEVSVNGLGAWVIYWRS